MTLNRIFLGFMLGAWLLAGCTKETAPQGAETEELEPIELGLAIDETRALLRTDITESVMHDNSKGFQCMVLNAANNATLYTANSSYVSGTKYRLKVGSTLQYWPRTGNRSFYAYSLGGSGTDVRSLTNTGGNVTLEVKSANQEEDWWPGETDVICAKALNQAPKSNPTVAFSHILSWVSQVEIRLTSAAAASGVTITCQNITFTAPRYGTYSLTNNSWSIPTTNKEYTFLSSNKTISGTTVLTGGDTNVTDYIVIPCTSSTRLSKFSVTWSVATSAGTDIYTRSASLTFPAGKKNKVTITLDDKGKDVSFSGASWDFDTLTDNNGTLGTGVGVR